MQWGRRIFVINESNKNLHVDEKYLDFYLKSYIKTNFRSYIYIYLNVIGKITNCFQENIFKIWG